MKELFEFLKEFELVKRNRVNAPVIASLTTRCRATGLKVGENENLETNVKPETGLHSTLVIRRASLDDAQLLSELGERTFVETFTNDNTPENMAAYLASAFTPAQQAAELTDPGCVCLIAEIDGVAVGYAMLRSGDAPMGVTGRAIELVRLYVSQKSIGSGVGATLMKRCLEEAHRAGFENLWLGVWEHNLRAQAFYRKWNFQEVGTHVFRLGNDSQTDFLMQRSVE